MQCSPLLARARVFQGCTVASTVTNGWIVCLLVCLRQFKSCTLVFISAVWFAQSSVDARDILSVHFSVGTG